MYGIAIEYPIDYIAEGLRVKGYTRCGKRYITSIKPVESNVVDFYEYKCKQETK